jgi:hypothetical protein
VHNILACVAALMLAVVAAPNTDQADCGSSVEEYNKAVAGVVDALRSYGRCVAQSDRHDDCAAQMQALDDAHDNFADAVEDSKDCK